MRTVGHYWTRGKDRVVSGSLEEKPPSCPSCGSEELSPLGSEDLAPPSFHGGQPDRIFSCPRCEALLPMRPSLHLLGEFLTPLPSMFAPTERSQVLGVMKKIFQATHHPWRQLMEREARYPDFRLGELPDLRAALETKGELGGGIACSACGKKPLEPHPSPDQESCFTTTVKIFFPCPSCSNCQMHHYTWDPAAGDVALATSDAAPRRKEVEFLRELQDKIVAEDLTGFWARVLPHRTNAILEAPGFARLLRAARVAGGANPPEAAMPMDAPQPLLRRLGDASPLFHASTWSVTCQERPALRLDGDVLKGLLREIQEKARGEGAASVLPDLARWNHALPFLVKTPPVLKVLGPALMDLRRRLRDAGVHLLPVAARQGLLLIDPRDGKVHYQLPHMQARDMEPPVALGFVNRMIYYQEPGELTITAHPLVAGSAWRTKLDQALLRWIDLGRYTVVECEQGLSELSGSSGKVRWTRTREDLGGLLDWTIQAGSLVAAGAEALYVLDPATGEITEEHPLPKRSEFRSLVHGDLPAPAAVIDQGYGPGLFAPTYEAFKGVKPVAVPQEGSDQLTYVLCHQGQVHTLWESAVGYTDRNVLCGPIEKKFAAKGCMLETELAQTPQLVLHGSGALVVPGDKVTVIDPESGEAKHLLEADATLGLRDFHGTLLAFGVDTLAGLDPDAGEILWSLELPGVQATDMPGPQMTPPELRPGYVPEEEAAE